MGEDTIGEIACAAVAESRSKTNAQTMQTVRLQLRTDFSSFHDKYRTAD
jgi:hypothetical protein